MRRTSLTQKQANKLAAILRERRAELGFTVRQVAAQSGLQLGTIAGLEAGNILAPQPDTLKALATGLNLSVSDLFAAADWLPGGELPTFRPYMRAKYQHLPEAALRELQDYMNQLADKYGVPGPLDGEDER